MCFRICSQDPSINEHENSGTEVTEKLMTQVTECLVREQAPDNDLHVIETEATEQNKEGSSKEISHIEFESEEENESENL